MVPESLPAQLARTRRFTLGAPGSFTVSRDGSTVLFLRSRSGRDPAACLWAQDARTGAERLVADPARLAGRRTGAAGRGIEAYSADDSARSAVFVLRGEMWRVSVADGHARRLPAAVPAAGPRLDPGGERIAYVSGGALRVIAADGTGDRAVAEPDGPDVAFGRAEHTDATAPDGRPRGHWWAPDATRLLLARTDESGVSLWYLTDPADPAVPPRTVRHTAAGTPNAEVTLWIAGLDGSRTEVRWDRSLHEYVLGAGWDAHGPCAVVQSRDQRTVRFLGVDPADGRTRVLAEQRDACWVSLVPGLPARTGPGALLGHTDLRGTRHLTVDGAPVTPPGLQLRAVLGVDGEEVLFTASEEPTETHLWCRGPGGLRRLSAEAGVHAGTRRGGTLVHVAGRGDAPGEQVTVRRAGRPPAPVASRAERPVIEEHAVPLVLGPRGLRATLHLPSWHRAGSGRLPILLDPYGGAGRQRVTVRRDHRTLVSQWFAEQGFAVLVADGRGTPGRGPAWERAVHGDLFGPALDDQAAAVREAARLRPDLDPGRVGIRGWSFSGSLAALAVLRRPDVFHAAVAGAGVTDQRLHHAYWRERFLGHPGVFPERYEAASLLLQAPRLTRPLLLMHGLADENVHPAHTLRFSQALLAAGRPHEVVLLPGVGHNVLGTAATERVLRHQVRFLRRHLEVARGPREE